MNIDRELALENIKLLKELSTQSEHSKNTYLIDYLIGKYFDGFRYGYYLPYINKRGWGVLYIRFRLGGKIFRLSTNLKIKAITFAKGQINILPSLNPLEIVLHQRIKQKLQDLEHYITLQLLEGTTSNISESEMLIKINEYKNNLMNNSKKQKIKKKISLIYLLLKEVERNVTNQTTRKNVEGAIMRFKKWLKDNKIDDDIENINTDTLKGYRNHLEETMQGSSGNINIATLKGYIKRIGQFTPHKLNIVLDEIPKIQDKRSKEERKRNGIALTHEDLDTLKKLNLPSDRLKPYRDLFIIQCQTGIRFEDFLLLLQSSNLRESNGIIYSVFMPQKTEKHQTEVYIPLNALTIYPDTLQLMEAYMDKELFTMENKISFYRKYERAIRRIAEIADITKEIAITTSKGNRKQKISIRLCDKISTHSARKTFITNCQRELNLSPEEIKKMSGHVDTKQINETYSILTTEDKLRQMESIVGTEREEPSPKNLEQSTPKRSNNFLIDGIEEAKRVLNFLSTPIPENPTFEGIVNLIEKQHTQLIDNYGIPLNLIKALFNTSLPMRKRIQILMSVCKELEAK